MGIAIIIIGLATFFASTLSAPTATTIEPAACVYSVLPHYTAYAANLPNQKLTYDVIDSESCFDATYACSDGQSLEAYKLADSVLDPIPWFAGIKYVVTQPSSVNETLSLYRGGFLGWRHW